jgi:hypothetical protein
MNPLLKRDKVIGKMTSNRLDQDKSSHPKGTVDCVVEPERHRLQRLHRQPAATTGGTRS